MAAEREAIVKVVARIADIASTDWDRLANPDNVPFDPFISHAFLKALEDAGTVTRRTGWVPQHLVLVGGEAERGGVLEEVSPRHGCHPRAHLIGIVGGVVDHIHLQVAPGGGLDNGIQALPEQGRRAMVDDAQTEGDGHSGCRAQARPAWATNW